MFKETNWNIPKHGIRQLKYIPKDDTQNYHFCRLQSVVESFGHSTKRTKQLKFKISPQWDHVTCRCSTTPTSNMFNFAKPTSNMLKGDKKKKEIGRQC